VKDAFDANIVVFSATDQDGLAQERTDLGHGVFSYALSEGLKGAANVTKRGGVSLFQLGEFVSEEVKRLSNDLRGAFQARSVRLSCQFPSLCCSNFSSASARSASKTSFCVSSA
jgi:hypothetical protein